MIRGDDLRKVVASKAIYGEKVIELKKEEVEEEVNTT